MTGLKNIPLQHLSKHWKRFPIHVQKYSFY